MPFLLVSVVVALLVSALCSLAEATLLSLTPSQVAEVSARRPSGAHLATVQRADRPSDFRDPDFEHGRPHHRGDRGWRRIQQGLWGRWVWPLLLDLHGTHAPVHRNPPEDARGSLQPSHRRLDGTASSIADRHIHPVIRVGAGSIGRLKQGPQAAGRLRRLWRRSRPSLAWLVCPGRSQPIKSGLSRNPRACRRFAWRKS